jgi:RNA polymerase sigma factor (sigma-70 family)
MRDDDQFTRAYDEHVWSVYGFFGYRVGSREEAEDLTQLTFERALKAWGRYDSERASIATWLMAIARNVLIDHFRRSAGPRHEPISDEQAETGALGREPADERALGISPELEAALSRLGERDRELLALRFGADLSGPEIAELTDLSLANVQQILSRSLRRLRTELEQTPEFSAAAPGRDRAG